MRKHVFSFIAVSLSIALFVAVMPQAHAVTISVKARLERRCSLLFQRNIRPTLRRRCELILDTSYSQRRNSQRRIAARAIVLERFRELRRLREMRNSQEPKKFPPITHQPGQIKTEGIPYFSTTPISPLPAYTVNPIDGEQTSPGSNNPPSPPPSSSAPPVQPSPPPSPPPISAPPPPPQGNPQNAPVTISGGYNFALKINNNGEVAGYFPRLLKPYFRHANGEIVLINDPPEGHEFFVNLVKEINDEGYIVGELRSSGLYLWDEENGIRASGLRGAIVQEFLQNGLVFGNIYSDPFVWDIHTNKVRHGNEHFPPGVSSVSASAMNTHGQVVGRGGSSIAFFWDPVLGMKRLYSIPPENSSAKVPAHEAADINDHGQVILDLGPYNNNTIAMWDTAAESMQPGPDGKFVVRQFTLLPAIRDATQTQPLFINNAGQVVGTYKLNGPTRYMFFWSQKTGMIDLRSLLQMNTSLPIVLNENGLMLVKHYADEGLQFFLWSVEDGLKQINPPEGARRFTAKDLNDLGQVVGIAEVVKDGKMTGDSYIWDSVNGFERVGDPPGYTEECVFIEDPSCGL